MKTLTTLLIICHMGFSTFCQSQTDNGHSITDTLSRTNLLDEQTKMYGQIFELAGAGEENPLSGATNYAEAIDQMDAPEEQKKPLRTQYKIYDLNLHPSKKDSLKIMGYKTLNEAIEKSQTEIEQ